MINMNSIMNYSKANTKASSSKAQETYKAACKSSNKRDSIEISAEAYEAQEAEKELEAASGKDILGITRGKKKDTYTIHFSDSAMVSRAVSRGYITVNGMRIELSDKVKEQLTKVDQQAQAHREQAFNSYIMQQNMDVAKQQGEVYEKLMKDTAKALAIASKIASGGKVSSSDERELMEFSPELYAMAKSMAMMQRQQEKHETEAVYKQEQDSDEEKVTNQDTEESSNEWKYYETQMNVSLSDTPEIQSVSEHEVILQN